MFAWLALACLTAGLPPGAAPGGDPAADEDAPDGLADDPAETELAPVPVPPPPPAPDDGRQRARPDPDAAETIAPADTLTAFDFLTPVWAALGCAVGGFGPFAAALVLVGFGSYMIFAGATQGGCGGAVAVIVGVVIAIIGVIPAAAGGVTAPLGTGIGTLVSRLTQNRPVLWPTLATLVGLLPGVLGLAAMIGGFGALSTFTDGELPPWAQTSLLGGAAAVVVLALLTGPMALMASTATSALLDAAAAAPPPGADAGSDPVTWARPRRALAMRF